MPVASTYKVGPYAYNSTYKSYNPSYPFIRPFIGVITPLITSRGPSCGRHYIFRRPATGDPEQNLHLPLFLGGRTLLSWSGWLFLRLNLLKT